MRAQLFAELILWYLWPISPYSSARLFQIGVKCKPCVRLVSFISSSAAWLVRLVTAHAANKVKGKAFMIDSCF